MDDLDGLFEAKRNIEDKISKYFTCVVNNHGDYGYQDLLERLNDIEEQILELTGDE